MSALDCLPEELAEDLGGLRIRWAAYRVDTPACESRSLSQAWKDQKETLESVATRPGQAETWFRAIYKLPEFAHYRRIRKLRFRRTEAGKKARAKESQSYFARLKADPERYAKYLEAQRHRQRKCKCRCEEPPDPKTVSDEEHVRWMRSMEAGSENWDLDTCIDQMLRANSVGVESALRP